MKKGCKNLSFLSGSIVSEIKKIIPVLIKTIKFLKQNSNINPHVLFYILPHLKKYFNNYRFNFPYSNIKENDNTY